MDDERGCKVGWAEGKDDFSLRVGCIGYNFFGFPGDFIVFEWVSWRYTFAVHNQEFLVKINAYIYLEEPMFPFFVYFIFKSKLDVAAAHLPSIHKQQRYFLRCKWLLTDNVVENRLRFVVSFCTKPESLTFYVSLHPASMTVPSALGEILLLISLGFPQECS